MADNVALQPNGKAMFAYATGGGDAPWWEKVTGKVAVGVKGKALTWEEATKAAGLDWEVHPFVTQAVIPLVDEDGNSVYNLDGTPATRAIGLNKVSLIRTDTLGWEKPIVISEGRSDQFHVVQNRDLFRFFDGVVGEGGAIYNTVGALGNGERVWVLAELPQDCIVRGKDVIKRYVLLANGHDGSLSYTVGLTGTRVVCQNTLAAALFDGEFFRIRHRKNFQVRAEEAKETLGIINREWDRLGETYETMAAKKITEALAVEFFARVFPVPKAAAKGDKASDATKGRADLALKQQAKALDLFHNGKGMDLFPGTVYNAYQAVTELTTHDQGKRKDEQHLAYVLFGQGQGYQAKALELARAIAK